MKIFNLILVACLGLCFTGCEITINTGGGRGVKGSGVAATETREVDSFKEIEINGYGDVDVQVGAETSVTITTDDNLLPLLESKVENGRLVIQPSEDINSKAGIKIQLGCQELTNVEVSGAAKFEIKDATGDNLDIVIRGAGSVRGNGTVKNLKINTAGAGEVSLEDLQAESVSIDMSGAGSGEVHATQSVDANVSGLGSIKVHGNPADVKKNVSGIGKIQIVE